MKKGFLEPSKLCGRMSLGIIKSVVGPHNISASILALSSLPHISYVDQFTLSFRPFHPPSLSTTPEQWARAMFGNVPNIFSLLIWRGLLGLRLSRERSPSTIAGWKIGGQGEDWVRLEASGWLMAGNMIVRRGEGWVELVTTLFYRRWLGWVVWGILGGVHRSVVPGVLRGAVRRVKVGR